MKLQLFAFVTATVFAVSSVALSEDPAPKGGTPGTQPAAGSGASGLTTVKQKASYVIGMGVARNLKSDHLEIDMPSLIKGLNDGISGNKPALSKDEISAALQQYEKDQREVLSRIAAKTKEEGVKFLADNKSKEGVKTTASGLQYKVLKAGTGATPGPDDQITANYKGTLLDGTVFDSSYDSGQPIQTPVKGVIPGWTEALQLMKVGDKWQLFIPSDLAYGEQGNSGILPNSVLVFEIELLDVKKGGGQNPMQLQPLNQK